MGEVKCKTCDGRSYTSTDRLFLNTTSHVVSRRKSSVVPATEHPGRQVSIFGKPSTFRHALMFEKDTQPIKTEPQGVPRRRSTSVPSRTVNEGSVATYSNIQDTRKNIIRKNPMSKDHSDFEDLIPGTHPPDVEARILNFMEETTASKADQGEWMEAFYILEKIHF